MIIDFEGKKITIYQSRGPAGLANGTLVYAPEECDLDKANLEGILKSFKHFLETKEVGTFMVVISK